MTERRALSGPPHYVRTIELATWERLAIRDALFSEASRLESEALQTPKKLRRRALQERYADSVRRLAEKFVD
jgi:hypothetical protein